VRPLEVSGRAFTIDSKEDFHHLVDVFGLFEAPGRRCEFIVFAPESYLYFP
jgi:hypothetical protein